MDRDWEQRRYLPLLAIGQKLIWVAPMLIAILLISLAEALGVAASGPITMAILIVGIVASLVMFGFSMFCWFVGYGRTDWQDAQAKRRG
ncbi:hypothetical protein [uncultured Sphingomonas sp.]|uniref:hypothetical protein n=1 Tax=uncultured Sphingomonas sp. TaxID=158754 RepID=UPI0025D897C8|nr:hypothetical protein [uncultured Sphingomonas sp.]